MADAAARNARLEALIAPESLNLAKRAAEIEGRSLSDFVAAAVGEAARRTIENAHIIQLTLTGQRRFAELMADPPEPGPGLRSAIERHGQLLGEP